MTTITASSTIGVVLTSPSYTNPVVINPGVTISSSGDGVYASAGSWTIQNAGTIAGNTTSTGADLLAGGSVTNQSGAAISGLDGVVGRNAALTVVNAGSIAGSTFDGSGVDLLAGGSVTNQSSAAISGDIGIFGNNAALTVVNAGSIAGNTARGPGVELGAGGSVTNQSGATISGYIGIAGHVGAVTVVNAGSIAGNTTVSTQGPGVGIELAAGGVVTNQSSGAISGYAGIAGSGTLTVVNAGNIAATALSSRAGIELAAGSVTNQSGATISGYTGILGAGAAGTVFNAGVIMTSGGTHAAAVDLSKGGYVANSVTGTISTNGGVGLYVKNAAGTVVNAGIISETGANGIAGILLGFGGSIINQSGGTISGGVGIDSIYLAPPPPPPTPPPPPVSSITIISSVVSVASAPSGTTTVVNVGRIAGTGTSGIGVKLALGGSVTNAASASIIGGNDGIYIAGGGTVVNYGSIAGLGANGFGVELLGGGLVSNAATGSISSSQSTSVYIKGGAGTVINAGSIASTGGGFAALYLVNGGSVSNSGSIYGALRGVRFAGATGTLFNSGTIKTNGTNNAVGLIAGGIVTNTAGALIQGNAWTGIYGKGAAVTVLNAGSIFGGGAHSGVFLHQGGYVNNAVTGTIGATGGSAVYVTGAAGTVINAGVMTGGGSAVYVKGAAGMVINAGVITGGGAAPAVQLRGGGSVTNQASGTIVGAAKHSAVYVLGVAATVVNYGVLGDTNSRGVNFFAVGGTVMNAGTIEGGGTYDAIIFAAGQANRLIVDPGAAFIDTVTGGNTIGATAVSRLELASGASAGTLSDLGTQFIDFAQTTIDAGASWTLNGTIASGETIAFAGGGAYLHLDNPGSVAGSVTNFNVGETIDLKGIDPASVNYSGGVLSFSGGSFALSLASAGTVTASASGDGAAISVSCFCRGTRIATPRGGVAVELLREGDTVLTVSGGRQNIQWIGHRRVDCRRHPDPARVLPIRIAPHAFGEGRPRRKLLLSPDHSVFVEDVLIPIKFLVNGSTVAQIEVDTVTYYHIELPRHDVMLADGMPAETYLDTGDRANFANGSGPVRLFPDFSVRLWEAYGYAPLIVTGPKLTAARALVASFAARRAKPTMRSRRAV